MPMRTPGVSRRRQRASHLTAPSRRQSRARHGSRVRIILARRRPAEIDEQPITEILGDVAAEARDGIGGSLLVLRNEIAPLLASSC